MLVLRLVAACPSAKAQLKVLLYFRPEACLVPLAPLGSMLWAHASA